MMKLINRTRIKIATIGMGCALAIIVITAQQVNTTVLNGNFTWSGIVNYIGTFFVTKDNIQTTSTDGITLNNSIASTASVTAQWPPRLKLCGSAWKSNATAVSETDCWIVESRPTTGTSATTDTLVFSRSLAGGAYVDVVTVAGSVLSMASGVGGLAANYISFNANRAVAQSLSDGTLNISNQAITIGSQIKADALPTVASGFGTSPAVTAGSTPLAGSINIGTGGTATSGIINFNGTAFPSAPFCLAGDQSSNIAVRASTTTTQLTLTVTVAWSASDIVSWHCISSK